MAKLAGPWPSRAWVDDKAKAWIREQERASRSQSPDRRASADGNIMATINQMVHPSPKDETQQMPKSPLGREARSPVREHRSSKRTSEVRHDEVCLPQLSYALKVWRQHREESCQDEVAMMCHDFSLMGRAFDKWMETAKVRISAIQTGSICCDMPPKMPACGPMKAPATI